MSEQPRRRPSLFAISVWGCLSAVFLLDAALLIVLLTMELREGRFSSTFLGASLILLAAGVATYCQAGISLQRRLRGHASIRLERWRAKAIWSLIGSAGVGAAARGIEKQQIMLLVVGLFILVIYLWPNLSQFAHTLGEKPER